MKRIMAAFLLFFLLLCLGACSGEEQSVVGTWIGKDGDDELLYVFREDGTGTAKAGNADADFTYAIDGNKISVTVGGSTGTASFEVTEDTLTLTDEYGTTVLTRKQGT